MEVAEDTLTLSSYDNDMSSQARVDAVTEAPGKALVSGRLLVEIARALPSFGVTLAADGTRVVVTCGRSEFVLPTMPEEEYPPLPPLPPIVGRTPGAEFARGVGQVYIAASKVDANPVFTGIRVELEDEQLLLAATDRYRLAVRELPWTPEVFGFSSQVVVPGRGLADIARALGGADVVQLAMSDDERELGIAAAGRRFTSRLLDGPFPKFREILPPRFTTVVRAETDVLREALKRMALVTERHMPVRLEVGPDETVLRAGAAEETHALETIETTLEGKEIGIAFNPTFLLDGLAEIGTPTVVLHCNEPNRPAVLMGAPDPSADPAGDYRYLIMPIKI